MVEICPSSACTGCAACANRCPQDAIRMSPDGDGFLRPLVDAAKCVDCDLCRKACPALSPPAFSPKAEVPFAAWAADSSIRASSSSGGLYSVFANRVVLGGGAANGVSFDAGFTLRQQVVETTAEIARARGSKYVQASVGGLYRKVERILKEGRSFLFVSTPCQVAGLKAYLGKPCRNLVTCDFVCHGVPSPGKFKAYLDDALRRLCIGDACGYEFRMADGWGYALRIKRGCGASARLRPQTDAYFQDFMAARGYRPSCYRCPYARPERVSDLTIADFWGLPLSFQLRHHAEKGFSLLLVNTAQGERFVKSCSRELELHPRRWHECRGNRQLFAPSRPQGRFVTSFPYRALRFLFCRLPRRLMRAVYKRMIERS